MILDDLKLIQSIDKKNMFKTISKFPDHIIQAQNIINDTNLPKLYNIQHIIVSGMGGSAISGDILREYTEDRGFIPISVYRSYHLPKWINKQTLVLSQSYSGNTAETISSFKHANEKKCQIISITSNGKLYEYSKKRSIPCIKLPEGYEPRSAIAFLFFCSLLSLQKIGLFTYVIEKELNETIEQTRNIIETINPDVHYKDNLAKQIANSIYETIPQIYGWQIYTSIARRWAKQFNENSKMISGYDSVPESNHNDIVGWSEHEEKAKQFSVIIFRDNHLETLHIKKRLDFMKTFYEQVASNLIEVQVQGKTLLSKMMNLIILGDYVSCYLAILQGKDPTPVSIINQLKNILE